MLKKEREWNKINKIEMRIVGECIIDFIYFTFFHVTNYDVNRSINQYELSN